MEFTLMKSNKVKIILHALFILIFSIVLFPYIGEPISWDELDYMELSANTHSEPLVMFRYTHIYLQKTFMLFSDSSIQAAKLFWLFLIGSTVFQLFTLSYKLSNKNVFVGFISVYLFFIQKLIFQSYVGVAYPDYTVMFFAITLLNVYYLNFKKHHLKLFLLSVIFTLSFKAKETTLPFFIIIMAELVKYKTKSEIIKSIIYLFIGVLSVIILFIGLDSIILNEPLFGISPDNFKRRVNMDLANTVISRYSNDCFTFILKSTLFLPIVFYLVNIRSLKHKSLSDKLVYLIPILYVLFIVLTMITGQWGIEDRYFISSIPFFCLFASLLFTDITSFDYKWKLNKYGLLILVFLFSLVLSHFILNTIEDYLKKFNWNTATLHYGIIFPVTFGLIVIFFTLQESIKKHIFCGLLIFIIAFYSLWDFKTNIIMLKNKNCLIASKKRFQPFDDFKIDLSKKHNFPLFISKNIYDYTYMLGRDYPSTVTMFNVFFNDKKTRNDIVNDSLNKLTFNENYSSLMVHQREIINYKNDSLINLLYNKTIKDSIVLFVKK